MVRAALALLAVCPLLVGCGMTSDVQEMEDGSYLVAANTVPVWNDPTDAKDIAYRSAQKFCAERGQVVVDISNGDRSGGVGSSGFSGTSSGSGVFAVGSASVSFRCR